MRSAPCHELGMHVTGTDHVSFFSSCTWTRMTRQLAHTHARAHNRHGQGHGYHGGHGHCHEDHYCDVNADHGRGVTDRGEQQVNHCHGMLAVMLIMELSQSCSSS